MKLPRLSSGPLYAGLLLLLAGALGWLFFGFGGGRDVGLIPLRSGEYDETRPRAWYWTDDGGMKSRAEVAQLPVQAWQPPHASGFYVFGGKKVTWLDVTVRNPTERAVRGVLVAGDYYFDVMDCWIAEGGSADAPHWRHERAGETVPGAEKMIWGRDAAFEVEVPARGERRLYLRAENYFVCPLEIHWWPEQRVFASARVRGLIAEGMYFGGLLALLGYNLALWLRLRLADIGCYVLYLGANLIFMMLARGQLQVMGWAVGSPWVEIAVVGATAAEGFFLLQFGRVFMELETHVRWAARATRWLGGALATVGLGALVILPLGFVTSYTWWMVAAVAGVLVAHGTMFVAGIVAWRAGVRQARYFLLAFGCVLLGIVPASLAWLQFTPAEFSVRGLMLGTMLEMVLLSLVVADRFVRAQRERQVAQEKLVEEAEQRRVIQDAYADELQVEVRERTRELELANTDKDRMLLVLGHDLRSPLTSLARAAEEEGRPGSAPGINFSGDVARTSRALLLLIEDLVLWPRLRAGALQTATLAAQALVAPAVAMHRTTAVRGNIELTVEVEEALRVETDLVLAQTLVRNLLANALKFARARVAVRVVAEGAGGVRFTVTDDGPGLPPEIAARFAADQDEPVTPSGGLGLRLCREIGRTLQMRVTARALEGGGTEFGFTLPRAKVEVAR